jgi:hypothetical protein
MDVLCPFDDTGRASITGENEMNILQILDTIQAKGNNPTRIVSLFTKTFPPLLKKGRVTKNPNPWPKGVAQITHRYGIIGCSYASCVNRQRFREMPEPTGQPSRTPYVPFRAQALWNGYGEHVPGSPYLVRHKQKDSLYLAFLPFNRENSPAVVEEVFHDVDTGNVIQPNLLTEYMRLEYLPQHQGVNRVVFWRTIELSHILQIKCGEVYDVTQAA